MVCLLYYFLYIPGRELRLPLVQQDLLKRDGGHTGKWVCGSLRQETEPAVPTDTIIDSYEAARRIELVYCFI